VGHVTGGFDARQTIVEEKPIPVVLSVIVQSADVLKLLGTFFRQVLVVS
jgi:hypothetical protein